MHTPLAVVFTPQHLDVAEVLPRIIPGHHDLAALHRPIA
jgi:hypothetical protein